MNLDRTRKGCVYVKVSIIVAVTEGVFVRTGKSIKLALRPEEPKLGVAFPCEWRAREGRRSHMSGPRELVPPHL